MVLLHADTLIDRQALAAALPRAWARVLDKEHGGGIDLWQHAYEEVALDWESYWADLDLNGDDSLSQWREGRWRTVRACFRVAGRSIPDVEHTRYYLDGVTEVVGAQAAALHPLGAWRPGAVELLDGLARARVGVAIVDPYSPAALVRGLLCSCQEIAYRMVIGPDELGQVGLEGIAWEYLASLAGADGSSTLLISVHDLPGAAVIAPPADLCALLPLITQGAHPNAG